MSQNSVWYIANNGQSIGPFSLENLLSEIPSYGGERALVFGPGVTQWTEARHIPEIAGKLNSGIPSPPPVSYSGNNNSLPTEFEIHGVEMQFIEIQLKPNQTIIGEPGAMMYMTSGIRMETLFGDPNQPNQGVMGKLMSAGKRMLTGESLFVTTYTASYQPETVAFAAPYPGKLIPLKLSDFGGELVCQKDSFICAEKETTIGIVFQKKIGVGLFGGEGFIMQKLSGNGLVVIHAGGSIRELTLKPGETLKVDTGCLVALESRVNYDIEFVGGIKNTLFGGEGLFFATLSGPGKVWLQSLPFGRLAGRVMSVASGRGSVGRDEGGLLGNLFGGE